jgi:hypothetical protein
MRSSGCRAADAVTAEQLDAFLDRTTEKGAHAQAKADVISARGMLPASIGQDAMASIKLDH